MLESVPPPEHVIISERDKGLLSALESKLPGACHVMAVSILQRIFTGNLAGAISPFSGKLLEQSQSTFDTAVQALQRDYNQVKEYLQSIGYENFAFVRFVLHRFGHDTSNIIESVISARCEIPELPPH